jgi:hypothetical protein
MFYGRVSDMGAAKSRRRIMQDAESALIPCEVTNAELVDMLDIGETLMFISMGIIPARLKHLKLIRKDRNNMSSMNLTVDQLRMIADKVELAQTSGLEVVELKVEDHFVWLRKGLPDGLTSNNSEMNNRLNVVGISNRSRSETTR